MLSSNLPPSNKIHSQVFVGVAGVKRVRTTSTETLRWHWYKVLLQVWWDERQAGRERQQSTLYLSHVRLSADQRVQSQWFKEGCCEGERKRLEVVEGGRRLVPLRLPRYPHRVQAGPRLPWLPAQHPQNSQWDCQHLVCEQIENN